MRAIKQLIYGTIHIIIFLSLAYGIYFFGIKPAPTCTDGILNQDEEEIDCGGSMCESCEIRRLNPLQALPISLFPAEGGRAIALVELRNPNAGWGASTVTYIMNFYDASDALITSRAGETFIYANEVKFIGETDLAIDTSRVARSEILIEPTMWQRRDAFSKPNLPVRQVTTTIDTANDQLVITGNVTNEEAFRFTQMQVIGIIFDADGRRIGASKTFIREVVPFEERFFQITIPLAGKTIDETLTKVFLSAKP